MRALDIIAAKRDGNELSGAEIAFLVNAYVAGEVEDYQMSAWLMAVCIRGMNFRETADLTRVMLESGKTISFDPAGGPFIDKHSTGGVGDKVSLLLAPLAAACGLKVPMMSGRSLGHTGGTLDKLDSIPGYQTRLDETRFRSVLGECGYAMTGQTQEIAPADRLMYSLRDASATVESIPLITASILSKKCAEGSRGLVFDVKFGSGAFMKTFSQARNLAESLVKTGACMGIKARALLTRMDFPLGYAVGNFLEVEESWNCLQPEHEKFWTCRRESHGLEFAGLSANLMELVVSQCAHMLVLGGLSPDLDAAAKTTIEKLENGDAARLFSKNVMLQGGDMEAFLAQSGVRRDKACLVLKAPRSGWITAWDAMAFGKCGLEIGVGRNRTEDEVNHDAGMLLSVAEGSRVEKGDELCRILASDSEKFPECKALIEAGLTISDSPLTTQPMIKEVITI